MTVNNTGLGVLTVTNLAVTGPFSQTNSCGSISTGSSCMISVTFRPKTKGTLTGTISIADNAPSSPQKVQLSATGTYAQLNPISLNFGNQPVGTKSLSKKIALSNYCFASASCTTFEWANSSVPETIEALRIDDVSPTPISVNRV